MFTLQYENANPIPQQCFSKGKLTGHLPEKVFETLTVQSFDMDILFNHTLSIKGQ
jgi:hypothetical protein